MAPASTAAQPIAAAIIGSAIMLVQQSPNDTAYANPRYERVNKTVN